MRSPESVERLVHLGEKLGLSLGLQSASEMPMS